MHTIATIAPPITPPIIPDNINIDEGIAGDGEGDEGEGDESEGVSIEVVDKKYMLNDETILTAE